MDFSNYSPAVVLLVVVSLALAPFVAVMVTSFTKIVVVLSLLRNALGLQQVPPNVVINGLAIVLSIYVMYPVILTPTSSDQRAHGRQAGAGLARSTDARECRLPGRPKPRPRPRRRARRAARRPGGRRRAGRRGRGRGAARARRCSGHVTGRIGTGAGPCARSGEELPSRCRHRRSSAAARRRHPPAPAAPRSTRHTCFALFDAGKEPLRTFLINHSHGAERAFFLRAPAADARSGRRVTEDHFPW